MAEDWARPVVHWELRAKDPAKQRDFYAKMFNWTIGDGPVMLIGAGVGAPDADNLTGHIIPRDASAFALYVQVRDLRESMDRAKELGGAVTQEPFDVPNGPTLAGIADPEGNEVVLVQQ